MATVIVNHRVNNFATWKIGFDSDNVMREGAGITTLAVGEKDGDQGMVYMVFDVKDLAVLGTFMNNPELQQRMKDLGVISAPEHMIIN